VSQRHRLDSGFKDAARAVRKMEEAQMKVRYLSLLAVCLSILSPVVHADKLQTGSIALLDGYRVEMAPHGTDSFGGKIFKEGGLTIYYDNLVNAGTRVNDPSLVKKTLWRKEQTLDGHRVILVFTKDNQLTISFPDWQANFFGKVRSQQDVADMLLMVLTYRSGDTTSAQR
jgi:hypothetical protein